MSEFTVKPAPGKSVRDPRTMQLLGAKGERKPRNAYWLRRVAAGDVVVETKKKGGKAK
ncbi:DUF2635 domain-containing protein [Citrobacter koseri]|uniref:DUF2635 domain-containing protein n=1 Tax=Citrobacter koseri TaxID=545 RepID=UPI00190539C9|nr:DUF2635 domain-containing protein [Citrobacter koseri]MBJ8805625.1 DUF2635 domain-containing protein [Citrobacter koseri]MBJ9011213.1 DUF2635 domain-containing protein [Citrobacter koseri]